jgi:hypothetical protein
MNTQADHPDPGSRDARLRAASIADQWTRAPSWTWCASPAGDHRPAYLPGLQRGPA